MAYSFSKKNGKKLSQYVLDSGMAAIMNDGQVDETALAKALASTTMWMMPEYTEIEPQPTWVGVEMEKNNATLFNGLPIGFRACAGDEDWMHSAYSAGWWSSTAGVQMGPEFGITVRMWSDLHTFVTNAEFNPGSRTPRSLYQRLTIYYYSLNKKYNYEEVRIPLFF